MPHEVATQANAVAWRAQVFGVALAKLYRRIDERIPGRRQRPLVPVLGPQDLIGGGATVMPRQP
jgi:hypothetical protein